MGADGRVCVRLSRVSRHPSTSRSSAGSSGWPSSLNRRRAARSDTCRELPEPVSKWAAVRWHACLLGWAMHLETVCKPHASV